MNVAAFATAVSMGITPSLAQPTAFSFEGEVRDVTYHPMFNAEIDIAVGESIFGQFTFAPYSGDGGSFLSILQDFSSRVTVGENTWTTTAIRLQAFDDHYDPGPDDELRVITDVVPDGVTPIRGPFDILQVGSDRSSLAPATGNSSSYNTQLNFWTLHLVSDSLADSGVSEMALPLEQAQIPIDVATWNSFAERSLTVSLLDGSGRGVTVFTTIGDLQFVPEPSSCFLASIIGAVCTLSRPRRWQQ